MHIHILVTSQETFDLLIASMVSEKERPDWLIKAQIR